MSAEKKQKPGLLQRLRDRRKHRAASAAEISHRKRDAQGGDMERQFKSGFGGSVGP
jgi:hypothetical protein